MSILFFIVGLLIAFTGSIFFAGSETGVLSADSHKLQQLASGGSVRARRILLMLNQKEFLLATLLIGNNLALVSASALTTSFLANYVQSGEMAALISVIILTPVILIIGEILPKAIYLSRGTTLLLHTEWLLRFLLVVFRPIAGVILIIPRIFTRKNTFSKTGTAVTREEFRGLIHMGALQHEIRDDETVMIRRLLDFKEKRVISVMLPLIDAVSIPESETMETAIDLFRRSGFSRLPVYRDRPDQVIGSIYTADFFKLPDLSGAITPLIRKPHFVPEQMRITMLFHEMLQGNPMAMVVDEYGVTVGIVTAEDLLEEIVGDIRDEFDRIEKPMITPLTTGVFVVEGKVSIEEFNEVLDVTLPGGDYTTVAGFLTTQLQKIPERSDQYEMDEMRITVLEASQQRVTKLIVRLNSR